MDLVADLTLVLAAALVGGFVAYRLRQPLIVGYLLAGVLVGPFTGGLTVSNPHDVERLAEVGVALLLFSLGLEVSFRDLLAVRTVAIAGGLLQIVLTIALGFGLGGAFGWPRTTSLWFGSTIALSSTMVALKTLQAQGRLGTLSSRVMLGILVVQDLAVVPLMIVLPALSADHTSIATVLMATGRALLLLGAIVLVATRVVPGLLATVARANSRELFLLTTTAVALGVGMAAWTLGISLALGAFIAGLVINESEYAHQALSDVIPLRDLFGMLFFVSVGMLLDPALAWNQIGILGITVAAVTLGKAILLAVVVAVFKYRRVVPLATALTLFQVGEFAFVLARVGRSSGALSDEAYALILNTAIVTMALTPPMSALAPRIYKWWRPKRAGEPLLTVNVPEELAGHVLIAGAGRVGRTAADALSSAGLPVVLVEYDARRFEQVRATALPVIYGDAAQPVVLHAAAIDRARVVLIGVPALAEVEHIVEAVRSVRPDVPIIARADSANAVQALRGIGIVDVTSPEFEAGVAMTRQALRQFQMPAEAIEQITTRLRQRP
jgi:CPA2 family monovalent cation:H+ antiporter-2